jgi:CRP-like cAMP-binding protein
MEKKNPMQEHLLSLVQSAKHRLEYLTPNDWNLLADKGQWITFKKGDVLLQEGQPTKKVYLLVSGKARVETASKALLAQIGPGEICGEMAFLENATASATVRAEEETQAWAVDWRALTDLFELFPHLASRFYRSLAVNLSRRLRDQISAPTVIPKIKGTTD